MLLTALLIVIGYAAIGLIVAGYTAECWGEKFDLFLVFILTTLWPAVILMHLGLVCYGLGEKLYSKLHETHNA